MRHENQYPPGHALEHNARTDIWFSRSVAEVVEIINDSGDVKAAEYAHHY